MDEASCPSRGGLARDTHRAECALRAPPFREGVNAETTAYAKLGGRDGQCSSCDPMIFRLARLEQSNDRAGIRYGRHWSHVMEPSQFLRLLQLRCFRFYYSILLRQHQSLKVSTRLDETSCPSRWSYSYFLMISNLPLATGLGLAVSPKRFVPLADRGGDGPGGGANR